MRNYNIHHVQGQAITFDQRLLLGRDWNRLIRAEKKPTMCGFAKTHGLAYTTWRTEFERGKVGITITDPKNGARKVYSEYDAGIAQEKVNESVANRGPRMKMTNRIDASFTHLVKNEKLSPYDARFHLIKKFGEEKVPCTRTLYNHINHGDSGVHYGETPYHPSKRTKRGPKPHLARTCPDHLSIKDRPTEADERSERGHFEMDTVVSCLGGTGGLLVVIDRLTREYFIEFVASISQEAILDALRRMKARGVFDGIKSMSTDNGCEFLDADAIAKILGCKVYYTRAFASYEKGSVENCNRIVRRWYPKGTNFALCSRSDISKLETTINGIHRLSLGGKAAAEYGDEKRMAA